jgi:excisionase family DNA binding protein
MIDVTSDNEHLLKVPSAARLLCMSEKTLRELIENGEIPFVMLGKSVRIPKTMLNDYLNVQLQKEQKEDKND